MTDDVFNVGSGTSTSLGRARRAGSSGHGADLRADVRTGAADQRRAHIVEPTSGKAAVMLGFRTEIDLPSGFEPTSSSGGGRRGVVAARASDGHDRHRRARVSAGSATGIDLVVVCATHALGGSRDRRPGGGARA